MAYAAVLTPTATLVVDLCHSECFAGGSCPFCQDTLSCEHSSPTIEVVSSCMGEAHQDCHLAQCRERSCSEDADAGWYARHER